MGLIELLLILIVVGFALYLVFKYIPMGPGFKEVITFLVVLFLVLFVLQALGVVHNPLIHL